MKKLILITSCVALFAGATYAQDTTKTKSQSEQYPQQKQQSDQMRNEDMKGWTKVQSADVPANLRTTLGGSQYTGWESGTVYRNQSGEYRLQNGTGADAKTYYFDKNGKASTKPNGTGAGTNPH